VSEHFVFVESNTTGTGRLAVERLLAEGHRVTFCTRSPDKYPFLEPHAGLTVVETETNDLEALTGRIAALTRRQPLTRPPSGEPAQVLLTFSEYYVVSVAEVAARLGFRYLSPEAARICRDKHQLRQALARAGARNPWFRLLRSEEEALEASAQISYPCVAKPTNDSSSKGVRLVADREELLAHYRELASWTVNDRGQPSDGAVLLESRLDGQEVSVETLSLGAGSVHTLGVCRKHLSDPPLFVELGHDFPFELPAPTAAALGSEVGKALRAVGFDFGFAHTEVRLSAGGPVVVEINPRLAGGMIPELVGYALGVDLLTVLLDQLRGRPVDVTPRRQEAAAIRFLTAHRAGHLSAVTGLDEARALPGVRDVTVTKGPGAWVQPAEHALHRMGYVIASGSDLAQAADTAVRAAGRIRIEIAE